MLLKLLATVIQQERKKDSHPYRAAIATQKLSFAVRIRYCFLWLVVIGFEIFDGFVAFVL